MSLTSSALAFDATLTSVIGLLFFFQPHIVADFLFSRKTDGVHWHLVRCVGGQMLSTAFVTWRLKRSSSMSHTVCHIMRILAAVVILLLHFQCRSQTPVLVKQEILEFVKCICFGGIFWNVLLLLLAGWPVGTTLALDDRVGNCLYQLDAMASICIGTAWLAFPKWLLHKQVTVTLDESHELLGRLLGAFFVASYCASTHALHWQSKYDRGVALDGRVVCCLSILSGQIWSQVAYGADWSGGHWVGISLFSTWTVIAVIYRIVLVMRGDNEKKSS